MAILAAIVALVVGIGIGSVAVLGLRKSTPKATSTTTKEEVATPLTASMTIDYAREYFTGTDSAKTSPTTPVATTNHPYLTIVSDPQAVAKTSIAGAVAAKDSDATLTALRKAMSTQRYTESVLVDGTKGTNFLGDYSRADATCQIAVDKPKDTPDNHYFEVKCLDQKQYDTLANAQEPFYRAYSSASASSASTVMIGAATITPSVTAGYQLAEQKTATAPTAHTVTAGPTIKYYAATDAIWHYFTDSSSVLDCSTYYKQPATTAAYVGTPCLDDKNQTVKVLAKKN